MVRIMQHHVYFGWMVAHSHRFPMSLSLNIPNSFSLLLHTVIMGDCDQRNKQRQNRNNNNKMLRISTKISIITQLIWKWFGLYRITFDFDNALHICIQSFKQVQSFTRWILCWFFLFLFFYKCFLLLLFCSLNIFITCDCCRRAG